MPQDSTPPPIRRGLMLLLLYDKFPEPLLAQAIAGHTALVWCPQGEVSRELRLDLHYLAEKQLLELTTHPVGRVEVLAARLTAVGVDTVERTVVVPGVEVPQGEG